MPSLPRPLPTSRLMNSLRKSRAISRLKKTLSVSASVQRPAGISPAGSRAAQASVVAMTSRVSARMVFRTSFKSNRSAAVQRCHCACRPALVALLSTHLSARGVFAAATFRDNFECSRAKREFSVETKPAINGAERPQAFAASFTFRDLLQQSQPERTQKTAFFALSSIATGHVFTPLNYCY